MTFPALWNSVWTAALVNHLWQSTVVFLIAWLLALALRRNQARTRYWVWMSASVKFLLPFSLLIATGETLRSTVARPVPRPTVAAVMEQITQPFPVAAPSSAVDSVTLAPVAVSHQSHVLPSILFVVWLCGFACILISWTRGWRKALAAVRASSRIATLAEVPVLSSRYAPEPGVLGIIRPVLLLPEGITDRLTAPQLKAIIAHEMCHVRRRDNLTAAVHMVVQAVFWFHPAVWWIKARLLEERERACDEAVLQSGNDADIYAESILNVCKFYVESPLACVAGVTSADLKDRIVRIMTAQITHKLDLRRKLLLGVAGTIALAVPVIFGLIHVDEARAQSTAVNLTQNIADTWQGTLRAGRDLRLVVKISKASEGGYKAVLYSIDQSVASIPARAATLQGTAVTISILSIGASYEGTLSPDGKSIVGTFTQGGQPLSLALTRATPETAWAIPEPPRQMDANASPEFEVATIKPSKPDEQRRGIVVNGGRLQITGNSLADLISFAYGFNRKQILGAPTWVGSDRYDIVAKPDGEGLPSEKQWMEMLQKLLVDRFKLSFHHDKKELSVYVLSVGKAGSKLEKSQAAPNALPGLFFRGPGKLVVANATISDFSTLILQNQVLDRPVIDQTGIAGKYDFTLNWTIDDSQFRGLGIRIPPPTDSENAPPPLYTAIQEQLGLKLEATKAPADVLVIDHVEKPSAN